jgi:endonuclease/exonuclease/phosphatase family metal-dependent hydrolase
VLASLPPPNHSNAQPELNLLRAAGWTDAVASMHPTRLGDFITWHNERNPLVPPGEPNQRLDYVWHSPSLQAMRATVEFDEAPWVSDHFGTCVDIRYRR